MCNLCEKGCEKCKEHSIEYNHSVRCTECDHKQLKSLLIKQQKEVLKSDMLYEKVTVETDKGTFQGWLKDSKGNLHNPNLNNIYILKHVNGQINTGENK